ncbi:phosphomannomutase/phosphoglucomutase [Citricoccus zhacaiensis]|uniref:Phosphomannomutase/phosphoglucomutase n=1 Tax=Citricoccus zhacaiensis TaxID=489142 RepID=A0ABQ2LWZ3_9MICC|nr:phosphomannomutase/phosphoglucomutase [Citricoccus zhacaiensis]GGO44281.1 phosphomannomutase/phosphoglucomutase [Citricoccus zhacaiensis]
MTTSVDLTQSFKAYDVRGIVGESITEGSVRAVGAAFVDVLGLAGSRVLVGGDMRPSSPEFARAFADGATSRGADVVMLGLISTDMLYYACGVEQAAGVVFTASHNPAAYNGMKMAKAGAVPVSSDTGLYEIRDVAQRYLDAGEIPAVEAPGTVTEQDMLAGYAAYLRSLVDLSGIRELKVVVDAGNGMAGKTTPAVLGDTVLEGLPLQIEPLYFELDGTFPNHPANPLEPENLRDLQRAVLAHGADIGLAFDGDADRCFVIDEQGTPVSPSAVTGLVARREIARARAGDTVNGAVQAPEPEPVIIHNLITSHAVPELVAAEGGRAVKTRVGHSFIKAVMAAEGAVFGGEHSAHYYFRDFYNADTGMLAAMHVLAALGTQELPLSELAAEYDPYAASGEINSEVEDKAGAVDRVLEVFASGWIEDGRVDGGLATTCEPCLQDQGLAGIEVLVDGMDGTTVTAVDGTWWFNLRPSNTEPFLRYNGEAHDAGTMTRVRDAVLNLVRQDA